MPSRAEHSPAPGRTKVTFTTRGSSILAAAIAAGLGSFALGETDLLRVAIIILLVCLGTWLIARLLPTQVDAVQSPHPAEATIGSPVTLRVATRIRRALLPGTVVCHDRTSTHLARAGHLAVVGDRARDGITLTFRTQPTARGAHVAGPLEVTLRDPLGLVTTRVVADHHATVLGLPRWYDVHPAWLRISGSMPLYDEPALEGGMDGEPDVGLREHRPEDGLRRIHWRSTARVGRLMARLDEPEADRTAVIAFESRARLHRGGSFETTLEVAASLGMALLRAGWNLRLIDSDGERHPTGRSWDTGSLLRFFALASTTGGDREPQLPSSQGPVLLITTAPPERGNAGATRIIAIAAPGRTPVHQPQISYVGGAASVADMLASPPRTEAAV
ncbi:DUF58 domain-containing protein [Blastococcus sp. Marseille-P5729]|uniref:DUF58 domain-containing protein n=1 Tax=Blastococcus sp. Marseille-P5729 TaxID=2086582 RepID=UPI000D1036DD|nr:DUF58 domain-containing protein [Blastococcus sp. Marseille-P5729]